LFLLNKNHRGVAMLSLKILRLCWLPAKKPC
jgi:hypothetical protein